MTPHEFRMKWRNVELKERTAAQSHFNDLCALLEIVDPVTADRDGTWFTFEKGARKTGGGDGWADVWRKGCFAWEYKGRHKDLDKAHAQLLQYAAALENPPLLIVSDMDRIVIHTNWTNTISRAYEITLDDLLDARKRELLRNAFLDPEQLKPAKTRQMLTEEAAGKFAALAQRLRDRGHPPLHVAHFLNRLIFCLFAEDANLLPERLFQKMLERCRYRPHEFEGFARTLFAAMRGPDGMIGFDAVPWFNGGLFEDDSALPLDRDDVSMLIEAAKLDWSEIDPSIMGTLFERGLDPAKRSQLGAHYTDRDKIMLIIEPVIIKPLLAEWAGVRGEIEALMAEASRAQEAIKALQDEAAGLVATDPEKAKAGEAARRKRARQLKETADAAFLGAQKAKSVFLERLKAFRVLDPACGSGNFLYLSLLALKDIEHRVHVEAEALGLARSDPRVGPEALLGIEINEYAAELARVSVWIGDIQWMRRNGFTPSKDPILRPLDTIENRDAIVNPDGTRAEWPKADVVVGNPPFLGNKKMIRELGEEYTVKVRKAWEGTVPGTADLVCFWFANAWEHILSGKTEQAGLVSTNSIRGMNNRRVLETIVDNGCIFEAWSDMEWWDDGVSVRVSMVSFNSVASNEAILDGRKTRRIFSDLSDGSIGVNVKDLVRLRQNKGVAFQGPVKVGSFDIAGQVARNWLALPSNPNGKLNSDILSPLLNGSDIMRRSSDRWIVDFGELTEREAAHYEQPFAYIEKAVKPTRLNNGRAKRREAWWQHGETVPGLKGGLKGLSRVILTPRVAKHRVFVFYPARVVPDSRVVAVVREDDTTFGILHSRFHEVWSLALGGWHGVGNDPQYTPTQGFETFPFPEGLTPNIPAADYADDPRARAIAAAAARLNELREAWLNPPDLVVREPEVVPGYPDRILPRNEAAAKVLKTRTLTNLYNTRPAWLDHAHRDLDAAVADAYGWGDDWRAGRMDDDEILARLFALNKARASSPALAGEGDRA